MRLEEKAKRIIERELQRRVDLNDDGSTPAMYDLVVGERAKPAIAIECVGAVDRVRTETWNVGPALGPLTFSLTGDWDVLLRPNARVKNHRPVIVDLVPAQAP